MNGTSPRPSTAAVADRPGGRVRLSTEADVEDTARFDRNSLKDGLRIDDGLLAPTTSGVLLRVELPAARLVRERIGVQDVIRLGRGENGAPLAGLSDGRICRVDPTTLELADVAELPAPPRWIGWGPAAGLRPEGLVAVTWADGPPDHDGGRRDAPSAIVHDLAVGKTFAPEARPTRLLLDRKARLWLGGDYGE